MSKHSESEQTLNQILHFMLVAAIFVLLLHFYHYAVAWAWGTGSEIGGNLLQNHVAPTGLFNNFQSSKIIPLLLLGISLLGGRGKKDPRLSPGAGILTMGAGLLLYFGSGLLFHAGMPKEQVATLYMLVTGAGFLIVLHGGSLLSRVILSRLPKDTFNRQGQSFPQEERLLQNKDTLHLPTEYELKGETRRGWINMNAYRHLLVLGSGGSGKSWYVIKPLIKQHIRAGRSMLVFDFKYPDLSRIAYNYFLQYKGNYPGKPAHYHINFEDLSRSHRCNCLAPYTLPVMADSIEAARSILFGLNMEWVSKTGDFWVESSINFVAGIIWYLRKYQGGKFCSWAHVIELANVSYKQLFSVLRTEPEIQILIKAFVDAFLEGNSEQLGGQVASANIGMARLSSPEMYYVLTGDDFTLDLNNPEYPKVLTLASSPQKATTYGAFLSVYINTINRLALKEGRHPFAQVIDEASTIVATSLSQAIGQGRGYQISVTLAFQDASQAKLAYGNKYADVVLNLCGNIISGQVSGDTAKWLADRFGKTMQERESISINDTDTNISRSQQLEQAIPASRISSLSSGEFVGMVADTPDQPVELKMFCGRILNDPEALEKEEALYRDLPVVRNVTPEMVEKNYLQVKQDIELLVKSELERMDADGRLRRLVIR